MEVELEVTSVDDDGAAVEGDVEGGCTGVNVGLVLVVVEEAAGVEFCGHSALGPRPFWKTPMMLVSPRSTSLHTLLMTS